MTGTTRLTAGASLAVLMLASAAHAQETTSAVHGTVTVGGKPVAGASVVLLHTPSGTRAITATEAGGGFDARGLRIGGPYTVTATSKGLPPRVLNGVFLEVGKTTDINIDMTGANEVEEVVITAAGIKDSDQGPKTVLNRLAIQEVVSVNRDPRDLARRDMLVAADLNSGARLGVNGGGISIAGSNPRYNRIAVDGVSAQDQFGLNQGGLTTARGPINLDAIEQFAVAAVPTDVENGDFVGGALNLALRSGGNTFHGAIFDNYLNDGLVGTKIEGNRIKSPISQTNYGAFLSGPIWRDHVFFAASYETYTTSDVTQFGVAGSGAPNTFLNNGTQATLDSVVNAYNSRYASKFNPGGVSATTPVLDKKYSIKLDWNITDGQRASLSYRYAESSNVLRPALGITTIQLDSQNYTKFDSDKAATFELHSKWTDRFSTFFKATTRTFVDMQTPPSGQNYADVRVCTAPTSDSTPLSCPSSFDQVNFGPDQFRHANSLGEKELRFQLTGEYSMSQHLFKFGVQARRAQPLDLFVNQSHGIYYFDSLADFTAGRASELQYQNSITGNPKDAGFATTYWVYSGFAQDTLQVTDDLKVAAGVRIDSYDYPDKPLTNPNFVARQGFSNNKTIDGLHVVMPRVSAEWRATPNLKISGGLGLFSGGTPDVLTGSPFYNTGYKTTQIDIRRGAGAAGFTDNFNTPGFSQAIGSAALDNLASDPNFGYQIPSLVQQLQQGTLTGAPQISPTGSVIALSPTYQMPAQWKAFLSGQWEVWDGWRLAADLVATKVQHDLTFYDARAQQLIINGVPQFLPDGRIRYDGLGAVPGKNSNGGATPNGGNDIIEGTSSKGRSYTASVSISKSWDWGGDFSFGYARQQVRDLTAGLFFGTTAGSLYNSVPAGLDPNHDFLGRSVYEIPNRYKAEFGYHHNFFGDNETRVALFAERQDGRPYGFTMSDAASGRSQVFGVTRTAQALYVPDFNAPINPANPLRVGIVTFSSQANLDNFKRHVTNFKLPVGLVDKYSNDNAAVNRLDLSISQQLPSFISGHKFRIQADIRNVLNLLNSNWGQVAEYVDPAGTSNIQLARVQCTDAAGVATTSTSAPSANPVCAGYLYSNVPTSVSKARNSGLSLWYAQISLRYEF
ncbi:TonB-dependent receptor domain-containing protein [Phenylobacterium sp.]|uniref:TonB-dependent receptor n=1 Tax=Phenylobacterium sp. TaxID=1871053 RepID=UPI00286D49C6|nr:TonB-dependent receptor [Phenylobacterium sp.]